jgi:ABC-2 type transport system ATP-binding protein
MKAALLSALASRPELVVLDEPFSGLDPDIRDELIRALLELASAKPCTILISSHDIEEVERLADWVGFLDRGRLQFAEPVAALMARFRLIEAVSDLEAAPSFVSLPKYWPQGSAGRTVRFIDATAAEERRSQELAGAYVGCSIRSSPSKQALPQALSLSVMMAAASVTPSLARFALLGGGAWSDSGSSVLLSR